MTILIKMLIIATIIKWYLSNITIQKNILVVFTKNHNHNNIDHDEFNDDNDKSQNNDTDNNNNKSN